MVLACWIQIRWNFWDISSRSWAISNYILDFLIVRITVHNFFWPKKCFLDIKNFRIWTRQASFVLFFSPESWESCLSCFDNCTLLKTLTKRQMAHRLPFQKPLFEEKDPEQVPWIIFVRLKAICSKTAVKMASKSILKTWFKKSTFTGPTERFYFFAFFCKFCPF
jgi:hypothetical protein